ncbi:MAG: diaminopropionate ammonia-lyase [Alphaproteobacteria bacterium]|nr:diaminopropionate ammonia-lyase [Alphaproteobacteria bacterium]
MPHVLFLNPRAAARDAAYGPAQRAVLNADAFATAKAEIASWPGYAPTPLVALPRLARALGVADIRYKDESGRFGLGSFKALGGAYAVFRLLAREIGRRTGTRPDARDLVAGAHRDVAAAITVTCATDGNHGRSVAWGARTFGCRCVIYIHETVSDARKQAIEAYGATVVRTPGNYDDSVRRAAEDAAREGWFVVSDTSYPGYLDVPRDVMQGYALMADEAMAQLPAEAPPTHVFVQAGVGGLAAAVCAHFWERRGAARPRFVVVEPEKAACLFLSARAGRPAVAEGALDTIMAGLACGEVSLLAWQVLETGADAFMTIPDEAAVAAMRTLADGDPPVVGGESGVAGLAGLMAVADDPAARRLLGLDAGARVLLFGSEGDTDAALYAELVGRPAAEVRRAA